MVNPYYYDDDDDDCIYPIPFVHQHQLSMAIIHRAKWKRAMDKKQKRTKYEQKQFVKKKDDSLDILKFFSFRQDLFDVFVVTKKIFLCPFCLLLIVR